MKKYLSKLMQQFSLLGKAMLVPIAVMPVAGLIGLIFGANMLNIPAIANVSSVVFSNIDFLFVLLQVLMQNQKIKQQFLLVQLLHS